MWPHTTLKNRIPVVQQMLRGNRCRDRTCRLAHIIHTIFRGEMLKHDFQFRKGATQRDHDAIDKKRFSIKHINGGIGYFAMHKQRHTDTLHRLKHFAATSEQIGDAGIGICRRACRIQLDRNGGSGLFCFDNFSRIGIVRQIKRHQRLKAAGRHTRFNECLLDA